MEIFLKKNTEIDRKLWDKRIFSAHNGNVFGYTWFLDITSGGWNALVDRDYNFLMPLPQPLHYGKHEVVKQSVFNRQLGIYFNQVPVEHLTSLFLSRIPESYRYVSLRLNKFNKPPLIKDFNPNHEFSYELDLIRPYEKISSDYGIDTKRRLKVLSHEKIHYLSNIAPNDIIEFYKETARRYKTKLNSFHMNSMRQVMSFILRYRLGSLRGAYDMYNQLCAAMIVLWSHRKIYVLTLLENKDGHGINAAYGLIDKLIQENSEKNLTLTFDCLLMRDNEKIYRNFGAKQCEYLSIVKNNMPLIHKFFISDILW